MISNIAVIFPSRGLSYSKTCDELLKELTGLQYTFFFSVGNNLPDCFNLPIEEALQDETFTHILIVEDDMIIPRKILRQMIAKKHPVVALDYPFKADHEATTLHDPSGMAIYTGTGFMLIERWVLDAMPKPIFTTDTAWDMMITKEHKLVMWSRDVSDIKTYGLHDVNFGITMWSNDIPIMVMPHTAGQRKLKKLGEVRVNKGEHEIDELTIVLADNVTKTNSTQLVGAYLDRLHQVTDVEILDHIPEGVFYEDGQAKIKENHDTV